MTCEELNSVWALKERIEREQRRLKDLELLSDSIVPTLDGLPHVKPTTFKVERLAVEMTDCRKLIEELTERLIEARFALANRLQTFHLNEFVERVLSYRYVSCLTFGNIAKLIGFTADYVRKLHVKGLNVLGLSHDEMNSLKKIRVQSRPVVIDF